ncbi:uncharacterized protein LOC125373034 [Haliotis rufescens]|uniref:uncharacterized protein LOC125373034 n=1 Tax=Haliotis rufescens TaxID=6454 RepID=UPI00201EBBFD|nr:uncharacterized protein LOC125373034 [Haliotis rufescens]
MNELPLFYVKCHDLDNIWVYSKIHNRELKMELDTGSALSIISTKEYKSRFSDLNLNKTDVVLKTYTGQPVKPEGELGELDVIVEYQGQREDLELYVVDGPGPSLLGRSWLRKIQLDWPSIKKLTAVPRETKGELQDILQAHALVFRKELGTVKNVKAKIEVEDGVTPKFVKARPVSYSLCPKVDEEIDRLVREKIIEPVDFSDWAMPIVPWLRRMEKNRTTANRLKNICPPDYVDRLPRDLEKNYNHLKATELQAWLLFYSIPCLNGLLDTVYLEHFAHLFEGIHILLGVGAPILLGDGISEVDLDRAETLLDHFYSKFGELYGEGSCGLNVPNNCVHLVTFVRKWGPLWGWSCFPFEDMNADILKAVHGTGDVTSQYLRLKELRMKMSNISLEGVNEKTSDFIHSMKSGNNKCWRGLKKMKNCHKAGQPKPVTSVPCTDREILLRHKCFRCT